MSKQDYHFDCGDSTKGPVGIAGIVRAESPEEAEDILNEALPETVEIDCLPDGVLYFNVYINPDYKWRDDIDEVTDV